MITSMEQAIEVQKRRVAQGLRGYSKAVRTFMMKESIPVGSKEISWNGYAMLKRELPVNWGKSQSDEG